MNIDGLKEDVSLFLEENKMSYKDMDFEEETYRFVGEMERGLKGKSSLMMLPAYIDPEKIPDCQEPIIVIDAGGTNFRRAVVTFRQDGVLIEGLKVYPMPGAGKEITKDQFFRMVVEYIAPIIDQSDKIGLCFSYPVEILPNTDGKVLSLSKELKIQGIESTILGETLNDYLRQLKVSADKKITVLNDTTAVLLSGLGDSVNNSYDSFIGLILGTGTNSAYIESNENILKNKALFNSKGSTLINMESGGYEPSFQGNMDQRVNENSIDPGKHRFEKMISGAYQGKLAYETLLQAAQAGLISEKLVQEIGEISAKDGSSFIRNPYSKDNRIGQALDKSGKEEERIKIYWLIDALMERAAMLLAVNIKAILLKTNKGNNPCRPTCLTIDGSAFYGSPVFQKKFDYYLKAYLENKGFYVGCKKVDNGTLIGTAMAALIKN